MANAASILRELVGQSFEIDPTEVILSGPMQIDWSDQGVSTSGNLYSETDTVQAWAFTAEEGFIPIEAKVMERMAASNANGTWENSYGYDAQYLWESQPEAIFFVIHTYYYHWDCNGRDEKNITWTLYKAPDFREHMEKVKEEDLERWENWITEEEGGKDE